jgi:hypothetical protein
MPWWAEKRPKIRIAALVLTTCFLVAVLAMHILEVARLAVDNQGVGLLPFTFVPIIVLLISLYLPAPAWSRWGFIRPPRPHGLSFATLVTFWCLWMMITAGIKMWSYSQVEKLIGEATFNGAISRYPYWDRIVSATRRS